MGTYKQRAAIVIQARLKDWSFDDENGRITGIIYNSINHKDYPEGERFIIMGVTLHDFPQSIEFGEGHYIAETPLGNCFRLNKVDQR